MATVAPTTSIKSHWHFLTMSKLQSGGSGSVIGGTLSMRGNVVLPNPSSLTIQSTTFPDEELRRGSRISRVLGGFGKILANSEGSALTFALSEPVPLLSVFISHNWSTPRTAKFLALALHFNLRWAFLATIMSVLVVAVPLALGVLPPIAASDAYSYPFTACYCTACTYVIPMIVLLYGHDLARVLKLGRFWEEPRVFLDKTCIHQTDVELQRQGILSLSAYLNISEEMVIVYRSTYLKKLWTVYELASMLMIKRRPRITVVTTHLTLLLYIWWSLFFVFILLQVFAGSRAVHEAVGKDNAELFGYAVQFGTILPLSIPFMIHIRRFGLERRRMHEAAAAFCIRSTMCFVEEDRKVVQRNVACFMRDFGFVSFFATEDEALDAFDQIARKLVPLHLDASFGAGMVYSQAVAMVLPFCGWCADVIIANITQGFPASWYLSEMIYFLGWGWVLFPLWMALCMFVTSRFPGLSKVRTIAFMVPVTLALDAVIAVVDIVSTILYYEAIASAGGFAAYVLITAALALLAAYVYRPRQVPADAHESCKFRATALLSTADIRHDNL